MHMRLWKASHVPWRSDGALDAATRFGLFYWRHFAISASGFLLEIVAMVFHCYVKLCFQVVLGFDINKIVVISVRPVAIYNDMQVHGFD